MTIKILFRKLTIVFGTLLLLSGCNKGVHQEENLILGKWVRESTDGTGPGNTLTFSIKNDIYTLSFDCSGSPGPGWPHHAETEYKFENGHLSYLTYYDPNEGFYNADSFKWISKGESFEIKFRQILLFMSADYSVRFNKVE